MRNKLSSSFVVAAFSLAAGGFAFAADMAVKAPPPAPALVPTWTGFYGGIQFGGGWSDEPVNYSPNDPAAAFLLSGHSGFLANSHFQAVIESRKPARWAGSKLDTTGNGQTGCSVSKPILALPA